MSFDRFDHDDHEPAAVVRTLAELSLTLVLMFSMIVGQRSTPVPPPVADARAATKQADAKSADVHLALGSDGKFQQLPVGGETLTVATLASQLLGPGKKPVSVIVLQFPANTLASQLYAALLNLQAAFTNTTIQTIPER